MKVTTHTTRCQSEIRLAIMHALTAGQIKRHYKGLWYLNPQAATIVTITDENGTHRGYAFCSRYDNFSPKQGRRRAGLRARQAAREAARTAERRRLRTLRLYSGDRVRIDGVEYVLVSCDLRRATLVDPITGARWCDSVPCAHPSDGVLLSELLGVEILPGWSPPPSSVALTHRGAMFNKYGAPNLSL